MKLTFPTQEEFYRVWQLDEANMNTMQGEIRLDLPRLQVSVKLNDDTFVGSFLLFNIDKENHKAEFGIHIFEPRGTLIAAKAFRKFAKDVFEAFELNRIYARIHADNKRSLSCAERIGFEYEGTEKQSLFCCGKFKDVVVMSILKGDFEKKF
jgi:RimJ/RimL family protein N-acetyltransferase